MAKCRLNLTELGSDYFYGNSIILCKKIHTITILGKTYYKNDYGKDSTKIQNFYRLIVKNIDNITYIKFGNFEGDKFTEYTEYYLKNKKLSNCAGPAVVLYNEKKFNFVYYIDGKKFYTEEEWKSDPKRTIWLRKHKLERIILNE